MQAHRSSVFRGRPAVFTGVALAIGITVAHRIINPPIDWFISGASLALITLFAIALVLFFTSHKNRWATPILFASIALFGVVLAHYDHRAFTDTWLSRISGLKPK